MPLFPDDYKQFEDFRVKHLIELGRPMPSEMWHYTGADGLVNILESGEVYFTQVSCLNDNLERRYFGDLILNEVGRRTLQGLSKDLDPFFELVLAERDKRDYSAAGNFVACFSEIEDDLGQWRGYGGGQCGYSIGFDPAKVMTAAKVHRPSILMLPMQYSLATQNKLVTEVVDFAQDKYLELLKRDSPDPKVFGPEFLIAFGKDVDIFASILKHPKFAGEQERRLSTGFDNSDLKNLKFRQKHTLLARHLPVRLTMADGLLPITRIFIGPGPSQNVSRISVGDLLAQRGYKNIDVQLSQVPYRVP